MKSQLGSLVEKEEVICCGHSSKRNNKITNLSVYRQLHSKFRKITFTSLVIIKQSTKNRWSRHLRLHLYIGHILPYLGTKGVLTSNEWLLLAPYPKLRTWVERYWYEKHSGEIPKPSFCAKQSNLPKAHGHQTLPGSRVRGANTSLPIYDKLTSQAHGR